MAAEGAATGTNVLAAQQQQQHRCRQSEVQGSLLSVDAHQ